MENAVQFMQGNLWVIIASALALVAYEINERYFIISYYNIINYFMANIAPTLANVPTAVNIFSYLFCSTLGT